MIPLKRTPTAAPIARATATKVAVRKQAPVSEQSKLCPVIVMYGSPKTGKTTMSYALDEATHIMTEHGTRNEHIFVGEWTELLSAIEAAPRDKPLVIDTIDGCWDMCNQHVADKAKVVCPSDLGYGQGTGRVKAIWSLFVRASIGFPLTLFIGHELSKTRTISGLEIEVYEQQLPKGGRYQLEAVADAIVCMRREGAVRKLIVRNGDNLTVGCRYAEWFDGMNEIDLTDNADRATALFKYHINALV